MESLFTLPYLTDSLFFILGAAIVFEMVRYRRRFDAAAWSEAVGVRVEKATKDADFLQARLEDIDNGIRALPERPSAPVPVNRDIQFRTYPTIMLMAAICGVILLYIGMFHSVPKEGVAWPLFAGLALMG